MSRENSAPKGKNRYRFGSSDTFGHDIGDELLKTFAKILQIIARGRDTIARIGGDEYTILLADQAMYKAKLAPEAQYIISE